MPSSYALCQALTLWAVFYAKKASQNFSIERKMVLSPTLSLYEINIWALLFFQGIIFHISIVLYFHLLQSKFVFWTFRESHILFWIVCLLTIQNLFRQATRTSLIFFLRCSLSSSSWALQTTWLWKSSTWIKMSSLF